MTRRMVRLDTQQQTKQRPNSNEPVITCSKTIECKFQNKQDALRTFQEDILENITNGWFLYGKINIVYDPLLKERTFSQTLVKYQWID